MKLDLFLISLLTLFLELTCIRWFPSHVLFLTFFTNTVLLACILGIAVGCLAARRQATLIAWTPLLLIVGLGSARLVDWRGVRRVVLAGGGSRSRVRRQHRGRDVRRTCGIQLDDPRLSVLAVRRRGHLRPLSDTLGTVVITSPSEQQGL